MMKYRKDIDGLRALAIVPVVLYHAFPQHLTGGFVGVDIFFIISGFLISTIIFTDIKNNSFSFLTFYTRRIKRIFPALILLFIFLIVFGYFYLFNTEYGTLSRHISSGALFYSNFKLLGEAGYWDIDSIQKPLLQLWSLGVEEQFYIVFPILMIGVAKLKDKIRLNLVAILISLIIISFGLNIYFVYENQPLAFYSPFTRMWELLMGSVLAYYTLENKIQNTKILSNNYVSLLGLLLIVVSILSLKEKIAYPGFYALLPTLGAVFIISTGENSFVNKYLLQNNVLVWIGKISYPLYLYHWSLLSLLTILYVEPTTIQTWIVVLVSVILAYLTYQFVEKPIRKSNKMWVPAILVLVMIGMAVYGYNPLKIKNELNSLLIDTRVVDNEVPMGQTIVADSKYTTLFIGDSLMLHYQPAIVREIENNKTKNNSAKFFASGLCMPLSGEIHKNVKNNKACKKYNIAFHKEIEDNKYVNKIVIAQSWNGYYEDDKKGLSPFDKNFNEMEKFIQKHKNKLVYIVLANAIDNKLSISNLIKRNLFTLFEIDWQSHILLSEALSKQKRSREQLQKLAKYKNVKFIDSLKDLCDDKICPAFTKNKEKMYSDRAHLDRNYVKNYVHFLDETINIK